MTYQRSRTSQFDIRASLCATNVPSVAQRRKTLTPNHRQPRIKGEYKPERGPRIWASLLRVMPRRRSDADAVSYDSAATSAKQKL
jgi:hypothetical protein